jgi:thiosulfate reductase cytochrome b subunit
MSFAMRVAASQKMNRNELTVTTMPAMRGFRGWKKSEKGKRSRHVTAGYVLNAGGIFFFFFYSVCFKGKKCQKKEKQ